TGPDETPHPIPRRGSRRIREAREVSRPHVHLPGIEAGGVTSMADPEEKKDAAGSAEAEPAPKRRRRASKPAKAAKAAKATKGKEEKRETPAVKAGQVHVYSLDGDVVKTIDLTTVF